MASQPMTPMTDSEISRPSRKMLTLGTNAPTATAIAQATPTANNPGDHCDKHALAHDHQRHVHRRCANRPQHTEFAPALEHIETGRGHQAQAADRGEHGRDDEQEDVNHQHVLVERVAEVRAVGSGPESPIDGRHQRGLHAQCGNEERTSRAQGHQCERRSCAPTQAVADSQRERTARTTDAAEQSIQRPAPNRAAFSPFASIASRTVMSVATATG